MMPSIIKSGTCDGPSNWCQMKEHSRYLKIVEWSDEDQCFVGRVPGLSLGGVHGEDENKVYQQLCDLVEEWIQVYQEDGAPLPIPTAGKRYSGKFNLRVGAELHERLAIESLKVNESLNTYCVRVLQKRVNH